MRYTAVLAVVVVGLVSTTDTASAAIRCRNGSCVRVVRQQPNVSMFNFNPTYSDPRADFLNAQANMLKAQAEFRLKNAQANVQLEQAQSLRIENQKKFVETRRQLQDNWESRRKEQLTNSKTSSTALAQAARDAAPKPLSTQQFDRGTGKIEWPVALQQPEYQTTRAQIETAMQGVASGGATTILYAASREMRELLRANADSTAAKDFVAASKFIDSLAVTARAPAANAVLARN